MKIYIDIFINRISKNQMKEVFEKIVLLLLYILSISYFYQLDMIGVGINIYNVKNIIKQLNQIRKQIINVKIKLEKIK